MFVCNHNVNKAISYAIIFNEDLKWHEGAAFESDVMIYV